MSAVKTCPQCGTEYPADVRFCPKDGSTLRAPRSDDLVGQVVADRYHIIGKLGEGGMGQVYLAEHVRMKRKSAVKVMSPRLAQDADAIQRFNREASNACQIAHPNVAAVYDFGETEEGMIYLAMEYIEGEPLTHVIRRQGALPPGRAANITQQTADGLAAAHELGIVHRDLKPDNIMIAKRRDGTDFVKVVDFGIAKAIQADDQKVTKTGLAVGTPEYMSPEQLAGDRLDPRTDIYSLGLVSFAMFTGSLPFPAVTSKEAMIMRLTERPRTLSQIRPDIEWPAELQRVFDLALANDAKDRYQDVAEFGRDVMRAAQLMKGGAASDAGTQVLSPIVTPRTPQPTMPTATHHTPPATPTIGAGPTQGRPAAEAATQATQMIQTPDPRPTSSAPRASQFDVSHAPQLQATGMMPAAGRPTTGGGATITPDPYAPAGGGKGKLWAAVGVVSLLALGAGAYAAFRPETANPPAAATLQPAPTESLAIVPPPSSGTAPAPEATPPATSPAPTTAAATPPTETRPAAAPMQADLSVARTRFQEGDYTGAVARLRDARVQVSAVIARNPDARPARQLRERIDRQIEEIRTACEAEQAVAQRRGRTGPTCP